jgi:CRISP-associated protein Cas1
VNEINMKSNSTDQNSIWIKLLRPGGLWEGWQKVRRNAGAAGGDGVTVTTFERSAPARLERLSQDLASGAYRPGPVRRVLIPKKAGGQRPLDIPCVADRVIQAAALLHLVPVIDPQLEPQSFAFRPGKSVAHAVAAVVRARRDGYVWTAEGDIRQCFESIHHAPLLKQFERMSGDARLSDLVELWLESYAPSGIGLPQGAPISPLLCNLHLDCVDEAMHGHGIKLVRYADDFVLLARKAADAEAALEKMSAELKSLNLDLNTEKTRLVGYDQSLRFLGHLFVRAMALKEVISDDDDLFPDAPPETDLLIVPAVPDAQPDEAEVRSRHAPRDRILYMLEPRRTLTSRNDSFIVAEDEKPLQPIHATRLTRIDIGPEAEADWSAMELAARHDVTLCKVDHWGRTEAVWTRPDCARARRLTSQAEALADPAYKLALAKSFAAARLANQRSALRRQNLRLKDVDIAAACVAMKKESAKLALSRSINVARGHEGQGSALYWPAFSKLVASDFGFPGLRQRRPPPDPVNACISYMAGLLERDIFMAVQRSGLHPGLGALHSAQDRANALIYDLMEAFRAPLVELAVLWAMSKNMLTPAMFVMLNATDAQGEPQKYCRMEQAARKALIRCHERKMTGLIRSPHSARDVPWRTLISEEVSALAHALETRTSFKPYHLDNDTRLEAA